jgi:hypothetical protein
VSDGLWGRRGVMRLVGILDLLGMSKARALDGMGGGSKKRAIDEANGASKKYYSSPRSVRASEQLHAAFPMGGLGAGMLCLEGTRALSHVSLRNRPEIENEPCIFAALSVRSLVPIARVLEGQVPEWKLAPEFTRRGTYANAKPECPAGSMA